MKLTQVKVCPLKKNRLLLKINFRNLPKSKSLNKLARMPSKSVEQILYAEKLHKENKITWIALGKALGIGGDSIYRRVKAVHRKLNEEKVSSKPV